MRLRVYCCAAALSLLAVAGCDRTPRRDNVAAHNETAAATTAEQHHSDPLITARIQARYFAPPEVKAHRIDVDTRNGLVTLEGTVDSEAQRDAAASIAWTVDGVTRVENKLLVRAAVNDNLRVQPNGVATTGTIKDTTDVKNDVREIKDNAREIKDDSWITMKIQSKFFLDDDVRARNIDVDTKDGVVTLKGSVESEGERQHALSIARSTEGVSMVHDRLAVDRAKQPPAPRR